MVFVLIWLAVLVAAVLWYRPEAGVREQFRFGIKVALPISVVLMVLGWIAVNLLASVWPPT